MDLHDLNLYKRLKAADGKLANQVESVCNLVRDTINGISGFFGNYTMHDMNHGFRVAAYMEKLAFGIGDNADKRAKKFNAMELALMLLSAVLHDIGMFVRKEDEENIPKNNIKYAGSITFEGVMRVKNDEKEAVKEIVRLTHAARIYEFLDAKLDGSGNTISSILMLNDKYEYAEDVALICRAHGEDYSYIKNNLRDDTTKGEYTYNQQYIAALLRIADYLDLDKQRTPILWFATMGITGFSRDEWEKHFMIQNEKKLKDYIDGKMQIYFDGKSSNAAIHRKYLRYIDELKAELENADDLLNTERSDEKYRLYVSSKIDNCVQTEGFKYSDLRLNLDYSAITELLMGENIYGDSRLGLRELIQNSIDACKLMREINTANRTVDAPLPTIYIKYSKANNYVKVKDSGIGMTLDVVKKHFLNIGKSYYKSDEYLFENHNYKPIGQYGIGFLSGFLLSDNITVKTKHYSSNEINKIELEKHSEYVVTQTEDTGTFCGTETSLDYDKFFDVFEDIYQVKKFLEKRFVTDIPIFLQNDDDKSDPVQIENVCESSVRRSESAYRKDGWDVINCSDFSDFMDGVLLLRPIDDEPTRIPVNTIDKKKYYIFNAEKKRFEKLNGRPVEDGKCRIYKYSLLDKAKYEKLAKNRGDDEPFDYDDKIYNAILALSDKEKKDIFLLLSDCDKISYNEGDITINDIKLNELIKNSGMEYFELLLDRMPINTFVVDGKWIPLRRRLFGSRRIPPRGSRRSLTDSIIDNEFCFYNKGIFVDTLPRTPLVTPYPSDILGYVNYLGDKVKLNVSRNSVNSGQTEIAAEVTQIILKYKLQNEADKDMKAILKKLIEFKANKSAD